MTLSPRFSDQHKEKLLAPKASFDTESCLSSSTIPSPSNARTKFLIAGLSFLAGASIFGTLYFLEIGTSNEQPNPSCNAMTSEPASSGSFDVVVVGAGAAGSAFARVLSEKSREGLSIAVLEGGKPLLACSHPKQYRPQLTKWDVPGEYTNIAFSDENSKMPKSNFNYLGFGVGGSTAVNGALYQRPASSFFELFPRPFSYSLMEPWYSYVERFLGVTSRPSTDNQSYCDSSAVLLGSALAAWGQDSKRWQTGDLSGIPPYNVSREHMYGKPSVNAKNGQRRCGAHFLCDQDQIDLFTEAMVNRLVMDSNGTATAVVYTQHDTLKKVSLNPNGKVVLAAGALQTPKLLWQSGIAPSAELSKMRDSGLLSRNAPMFPASSVGATVVDKTLTSCVFSHKDAVPWKPNDKDRREFLQFRRGPFSQFGPTLIAHIKSPFARDNFSDVEYFVGPDPVNSGESVLPHAFRVWTVLLDPQSRSSFRIVMDQNDSSNGFCGSRPCQVGDVPEPVDLFLTDTNDQKTMIWAVTNLVNVMKSFYPNITVLSPWNLTADAIRSHVLSSGQSPGMSRAGMNHFTGTVPWNTAVDPETLQVKTDTSTLNNVHVVDASLIPGAVAVHPVGTHYAVGARSAEIISGYFR
mmetsp:Transcript_4750/g.9167  ORF Transcript_4750/g.9167 Transcript_4750/m.9167 type:complete len:634 (-) Transcript_4750:7-1908(-)